MRCAAYRRRATRRTDHKPASSNVVPMNTAVWLDTAGAGLSSAHTPPLQSALAHWRLSLHTWPSLRLWGVGVVVAVGVGVLLGVGVGVDVLVGVAVGVKATHAPKPSQTPPALQGIPTNGMHAPAKQVWHWLQAGMHCPQGIPRHTPPRQVWHWSQGGMHCPMMPPALARAPASRSTTSTASPIRVMAAGVPQTTVQVKVSTQGRVTLQVPPTMPMLTRGASTGGRACGRCDD